MKTVMLVDDERPARELLKLMIDWNNAGFEILCEARNGKQALEMYAEKKPDLIITDVQMPVMDGLEFLEHVKELCPSQNVVILSCHENFSYARRALKAGVLDYLLKDALTEEILYNLLKGLVTSDSTASSAKLSSSVSPLILRKSLSNNPTEQQEGIHRLDAFTSGGNEFFCCTCCLENFTGTPFEWSSLSDELQNMLNRSGECEVVVYREHYLLVLFLMKHQSSQMEVYNNRFQNLRLIRKQLEILTGCTVSIGVSTQSRHPNALNQLINESFEALKSKVFQGTGKNLYYNTQYNRNQSLQFDTLNSQFRQIRSSVEKPDEEALIKNLEQIYGKALDGITHYHYLNYVNALLVDLLMERCQKLSIAYETVFKSDALSFDVFEKMNTPDALLQWFRDCFLRLFRASGMENPQYSSRIRSILQYIQNNFHHDISLETIADTFWLHKVYLAKIFKQETGKSVNEYIRNLRIEKAKEMLMDNRIKISEIVTATGFNNPQSFYTIFRKYVGMKPGEYRDRILDQSNRSKDNA